MGATTAPSVKFDTADSWYVDEGRLVILDEYRTHLAEFAQGYWTHIILVD